MNAELTSPLIEKYQNYYEKNNSSRIFAPLAESYRKLGLLEEAFNILKKGIKLHPDYAMGFLVLAACYYDKNEYELAYNTLYPITSSNRDNIKLQKLFANVATKLGRTDEALDTFKYLLFINPKDKEVANKVKELEKKDSPLANNLDKGLKKNQLQLFDISNIPSGPDHLSNDSVAEDWVQMDLSAHKEEDDQTKQAIKEEKNTSLSWEVGDIAKVWKKAIDTKVDKSIKIDIDNSEVEEDSDVDFPVITHTLVDLYCQQGYYTKAKEILEKLLILDPQDKKTLKKIAELNQVISSKKIVMDEKGDKSSKVENVLEDKGKESHPVITNEGRDKLMQCLEQKLSRPKNSKIEIYEKYFNAFLNAIKSKSESYRSI